MDTLYNLSHLGPQALILSHDSQVEKVENVWLHSRQRYRHVIRTREAELDSRLILVCLCLPLGPNSVRS